MAFFRASFLLSLALLLVSFNTGSTTEPQRAENTWCVATPSSDDITLSKNIKYACSHVNCTVIEKGNACFEPDTLMNHASVAMNLYYQSTERNSRSCALMNSTSMINGLVVITDPSYDNCFY